jgi:hypothetical protein
MALWRLRTIVDDRPGFLAVLTASLALKSVNILSVQVHGTETGAVDDFLVDAPDSLTEPELLAAVAKGRGREAWVRRSEAQRLVDAPTEILGAAMRIIRDPNALISALDYVMLASTVTCVPASEFASGSTSDALRPGFTANRMQILDPAGDMLLIERPAPAYTPAEYARARALVDVAIEIRRMTDEPADTGA